MVASLDLTSYLQAASPPAWIGHSSYAGNSCAMVHSHSSVDLLRTAVRTAVIDLPASTCCEVLPSTDDDDDVRNCDFRSRDTAAAGH